MDLHATKFVVAASGNSPERPVLSLDVRDVRLGSKIRRYALTLECSAVLEDGFSDDPRLAIELWAELSVRDSSGSRKVLGRATTTEMFFYEAASGGLPQHRSVDPRYRQMSLALDLTLDQLEAMEELRSGRDLVLGLQPGGYLHTDGDMYRLYPSNHQLSVTVSQSDWVRLLQGANYVSILTVELPMPDSAAPGDLTQAVQSLDKARAAYLRGDYEEAVADCREGLVVLARSGDDRFDSKKKWSSNAGKRERFWRVQRALLSVTNLAHHPEDRVVEDPSGEQEAGSSLPIDWGRADAHSVIVMLAALVFQKTRRA